MAQEQPPQQQQAEKAEVASKPTTTPKDVALEEDDAFEEFASHGEEGVYVADSRSGRRGAAMERPGSSQDGGIREPERERERVCAHSAVRRSTWREARKQH